MMGKGLDITQIAENNDGNVLITVYVFEPRNSVLPLTSITLTFSHFQHVPLFFE
jgi:hypothetical protein